MKLSISNKTRHVTLSRPGESLRIFKMPAESLRTTENLKECSRILVNLKDSLRRPMINLRPDKDVVDDLDAVFGQFGELFRPNWTVFLAFTKTVLTIWMQFLDR